MSAVRGIAKGAALAASFVALLVACSGDPSSGAASGEQGVGSSGACTPYAAPASTDLAKPTVSFARDVAPIFAQSCTFSSCHATAASEGHLVLKGDGVRARLLKGSLRLPSMPYVTPGHPEQSFLMHKLDGDSCTLDAQCVDGDCLDTMPKGGDPLPQDQRDTLRRWIAQGGADD